MAVAESAEAVYPNLDLAHRRERGQLELSHQDLGPDTVSDLAARSRSSPFSCAGLPLSLTIRASELSCFECRPIKAWATSHARASARRWATPSCRSLTCRISLCSWCRLAAS
jgi:hypothetical protein